MNALRFHKDFYSKRALTDAVDAFAEVARFTVSQEGEYWVLSLETVVDGDDSADTLAAIVGSLQNHALANIVRGKQS